MASWLCWALGEVEGEAFEGMNKMSKLLSPGGVDLGLITICLVAPLILIEFAQMTRHARSLLNMHRFLEDGTVREDTYWNVFMQCVTPTQVTDWCTYALAACNVFGMGKIEELGNVAIAVATFLVIFRFMRYLTAIKQVRRVF